MIDDYYDYEVLVLYPTTNRVTMKAVPVRVVCRIDYLSNFACNNGLSTTFRISWRKVKDADNHSYIARDHPDSENH